MAKERLNYSGYKIIYRIIADNFIVRLFTRVIMFVLFVLDRTYSHLKLRVLVKDAGNCLAHWTIVINYGENIKIGKNVGIGPYCSIGAMSPVILGDDVRISRGVIIETGGLDFSKPPPYQHKSKPITIGNGVWLGTNSMIMAGVTIGNHAVIGANTVVTKDIPPYCIVVGQPFRILDKRIQH